MAYLINIACNNPDNGMPFGKAERIDFCGAGAGDVAECVDTLLGGGQVRIRIESVRPAPANRFAKHLLRIGRLRIFCLEYRPHHGNWCWDGAWVAGVDALRIANYLTSLKWWQCEAGPSSFFEKFNAKQRIEPGDMP